MRTLTADTKIKIRQPKPRLSGDTKIKLSQIKDLAAWIKDKHSGAKVGDIHRWTDGTDHIKTAHGWKPVTKEADKKRANSQVINSWATEENKKWATGKTKNDVISKFGNKAEPIGLIPEHVKKLFNGISDNKLYCGKGYFIDHMANHHGEIPVSFYKNLQKNLENSKLVFHDTKNNSIVLSNEIGPKEKELLVIAKEPKTKKLILYKSFYVKESKNYPGKFEIITPEVFPGV